MSIERGHEERDVSARTLFVIGGAMVAIAAVIQVALYLQMFGLWRARARELPPPLPVASALPTAPPEPRLQTSPEVDLQALRREEDALLEGSGWVDRGAGVVRIPIERAMTLVAKDGGR